MTDHLPAAPSGFLQGLTQDAEEWARCGLVRRRRTLDGPAGPHIRLRGERGEFLSFLSNDYLGLASVPSLREAISAGAARWGSGAGSSALISGHLACHADAEAALAEFTRFPAALLFITGYMANLAIIGSLLHGPGDAVFSDNLNHASLIDGCRLSRARIVRYPHLDLDALSRLLASTEARRRLIVTDAVFSMDGDTADLPGLLALAERHDALLLVDDAHGFGLRGPQGRGSIAAADLRSERLILMGTLGKGAGLSGAFVAASNLIIEHLVQRGRTYVFSTAPAPAVAYAIPLVLELIAEGEARRAALVELRTAAALLLRRWRFPAGEGEMPIIPVFVGEAEETMGLVEALAREGVLVAGIRPPTVPEGTSRLRISLSATHSLADIVTLGAAAQRVGLLART